MLHGVEFANCDYLLVQEHAVKGEERDKVVKWAAQHGWDARLDHAFVKNYSCGGGTGVLARTTSGARPTPEIEGVDVGRLTICVGDIGGEASLASCYGITGECLKQQLPLWGRMAQRLKAIGRPFVAGGG